MGVLHAETKSLFEQNSVAQNQTTCPSSVALSAHRVADFEKVLSQGESAVVIVSGAAGMGKTSLLCAFLEAGRRLGWNTHDGQIHELQTLDRDAPTIVTLDNVVKAQEASLMEALSAFKDQHQRRRPIVLVLAVRSAELSQMPGLQEFCRENSHVFSLNSLTRTEVETLIQGALLDKDCCQEFFNRLVQETAGHPLMMSLMLEELKTCPQITDQMISSIVESARSTMAELVWEPLIAGLSDGDFAFLEAMAVDDEPSRMHHISTRLGKTPQYAGVYRNRLVAAEIIRAASYGKVTFATPLLRHYVRQLTAQRMENQF